MTSSAMASFVVNNLGGSTNASEANNKFFKALCDYCEQNMQIFYSWVATTPPPASVPDPMTVIECKVKTTGTLSPSGVSDCNSALAAFSSNLNSQAVLWQIVWPAGFSLSPAFILPTIKITPSMAENPEDAWNAVCSQIIDGLKLATPTASGTHGSYVGVATFTNIL